VHILDEPLSLNHHPKNEVINDTDRGSRDLSRVIDKTDSIRKLGVSSHLLITENDFHHHFKHVSKLAFPNVEDPLMTQEVNRNRRLQKVIER
jgi:hypothetical protein